jgi:hypothetical protein
MYCVFRYIFLFNYFDCLSSFLCVWQTFLHSWLYTEPQVLLAFAGILLFPLFLLSSPFVDILIWRNHPHQPTWRSPFLHVHLLICECLSSNFWMSCLPMEVSLLCYKPSVFSLHVPSCCCRRIVRMPIRTVGEKYFSKRETEGRNRLWVMSGITPLTIFSFAYILALSHLFFSFLWSPHGSVAMRNVHSHSHRHYTHTHTHTHTPDDECIQ